MSLLHLGLIVGAIGLCISLLALIRLSENGFTRAGALLGLAIIPISIDLLQQGSTLEGLVADLLLELAVGELKLDIFEMLRPDLPFDDVASIRIEIDMHRKELNTTMAELMDLMEVIERFQYVFIATSTAQLTLGDWFIKLIRFARSPKTRKE